MPRAPKHCGNPTCDNLTTTTYCPQHTPNTWNRGNRTNRARGPKYRTWRNTVLTRDQHQCQLRHTGCTHIATEADHITPAAEGGALYDPNNGQAACHTCHTRKSRIEQQKGHEAYTNKKHQQIPPPPPF